MKRTSFNKISSTTEIVQPSSEKHSIFKPTILQNFASHSNTESLLFNSTCLQSRVYQGITPILAKEKNPEIKSEATTMVAFQNDICSLPCTRKSLCQAFSNVHSHSLATGIHMKCLIWSLSTTQSINQHLPKKLHIILENIRPTYSDV